MQFWHAGRERARRQWGGAHIDDADDIDGGAVHLAGCCVDSELDLVVTGAAVHRDD